MTEALFSFDTLLFVSISVIGYFLLIERIGKRDRALETNPLAFPDLLVCIVLGSAMAYLALLSAATSHPAAGAPLKTDQVIPGSLLLLFFAACIGGFVELRHISIWSLLGLGRLPVWKAMLCGVGLLFLALPMLMWVSALIAEHLPKDLSEEQQLVQLFQEEARKGQYGGLVKILTAAVFMAPPGEEFLFRGYFYPAFKRYFGRIGSAVLTAALFALLHANLASAGGLFLLALCLTAAYEWSGSLIVPITMHATFNLLSLSVLYLHVEAKP